MKLASNNDSDLNRAQTNAFLKYFHTLSSLFMYSLNECYPTIKKFILLIIEIFDRSYLLSFICHISLHVVEIKLSITR